MADADPKAPVPTKTISSKEPTGPTSPSRAAPARAGAAAPRLAPASLPFDVLEAKLVPPLPRATAIARAPLLTRLRAQHGRVVTVTAPPGYGKTILAGQWAGRDERPVAWLTVDGHDNDPLLLLRHLAAAFRRIGVRERGATAALGDPAGDVWRGAAPRLLNAIGAAHTPFLLVLDGADRIGGEAADVLVALVDGVPPGSTVVLTGRCASAVPLAPLRADRDVQEVGLRDLAFTARDVKLRAAAAGLELDEPAIAELHRTTEGWPIAVDLAVSAITADFAVDRAIAEYIGDELLAPLRDELRTFLRQTSVLDELSVPLCDAVVGTGDAAPLLDELERDGRFLIPLDRNGECYRFHPLVRAALQRELRIRDGAVVDGLQRRAARWYQRHGDVAAAVPFALAAGDHAEAATMIAAVSAPLSAAGRGATVLEWIDALDGLAPLSEYPYVALLGGWMHALEGDAERATACIFAAQEGGAARGCDAEVAATTVVLRAALCLDPVDTVEERLTAALADLPGATPRRVVALVVRGATRALHGDHAGADEDLAAATRVAGVVGQAGAHVFALAARSLVVGQAGDLATSSRLAFEAADRIRRGPAGAVACAALAHAQVAAAMLRQGRWDGARAELTAAERAAEHLTHALPWMTIPTRLTLASAYVALRDRAAAEAALAEAERVLELRPLTADVAERVEALRREVEALPDPAAHGTAGLTRAELRLLPLLATHLSFREIGEHLFVSRNTVKTQAISIYRKLGATSRSGTIARAAELGLVDADALHADRTM